MNIIDAAPTHWERITLGELTASTRPICYGVLKPGPDVLGGVPLVRIQDLKDGTVDTSALHYISHGLDTEFARSRLGGGEVLISIQGTIGRVAICPQALAGANISRTIAVIKPDERVLPKFLLRYLQLLDASSAFPTQGATRASLNIGALRKTEVPFPSVDEQRRLIRTLDGLEGRLASGVAQIARAEAGVSTYVWSVMANAFRGPWKRVPLREVAALSSGRTPARTNPGHFGGNVPWVKIGDLTEGPVGHTAETLTERGLDQSSAELLPAGTVLLAMYGASIGRTGVLVFAAATNQAICAMQPDLSVLSREYLFHYLRFCKPRFVAAGYGGAQPNISMRFLKEFEIPLPPLDEQRRAVALVDKHRQASEALQTDLARARQDAEDLRRSLLYSTFAGTASEEGNWHPETDAGARSNNARAVLAGS